VSELAVYTLLKDAAGVAALVAGRVYPLQAPQNATAPFIVYQRISSRRVRSVDGPSGLAQPRIQVDAYAATYAGAKALASAIRTALDGYRGTVAGVRVGAIALVSDTDFLED
jgi:hypothetical protein